MGDIMNMVFKDGKIYVVTEFGFKQVGYYSPASAETKNYYT